MQPGTATPAPAPEVSATASSKASPRRTQFAVVDVNDGWHGAAGERHKVRVVAPGADLPERLAQLGASTVLANLAGRGVLDAVVAARAAGVETPFLGCLGIPEDGCALLLGPIVPIVRPLGAEAIVSAVARFVSKGTRVALAGPGIDELLAVRKALTTRGVSVSVGFDAAQASDVFGMVRPEVAVVDLALPPRGGCAIVARLLGGSPVPTVLVLPEGADPAAGFNAALADPALGSQLVTVPGLFAAALRYLPDANRVH